MQEIEVKRNLNKIVSYGGKDDLYMLTGVVFRREINNGPFYYTAELTDMKAGNLIYDTLDKVNAIDNAL